MKSVRFLVLLPLLFGCASFGATKTERANVVLDKTAKPYVTEWKAQAIYDGVIRRLESLFEHLPKDSKIKEHPEIRVEFCDKKDLPHAGGEMSEVYVIPKTGKPRKVYLIKVRKDQNPSRVLRHEYAHVVLKKLTDIQKGEYFAHYFQP